MHNFFILKQNSMDTESQVIQEILEGDEFRRIQNNTPGVKPLQSQELKQINNQTVVALCNIQEKPKEDNRKTLQSAKSLKESQISNTQSLENDQIKVSILSHNAMAENQNLNHTNQQLRKDLPAEGQLNPSSGTQEEKLKKIFEQSCNTDKICNYCLQTKLASDKAKEEAQLEITKLNIQLGQQKNSKKDYMLKINQLQKAVKNRDQLAKSSESQYKKNVESLKKQLLIQYQKEVIKYQKKNNDLKQLLQFTQHNLSQLSEQNQSNKQYIATLQSQNDQYFAQNLKGMNTLQRIINENDSFKAQIISCKIETERCLKEIEASKQTYAKKISQLGATIDQKDELSTLLKAEATVHQRKIQNLEKSLANSNYKTQKLTQQNEKIKGQAQKLKQQIARVRLQMQKLKQESNKVKQQIEKLKKDREIQSSKYQAQIKSIKSQKQSILKDYQNTKLLLKKQKAEIQRISKERQTQKNKFKAQISDSKAKIDLLLKELAQEKILHANDCSKLQKQIMLRKKQFQELLYILKGHKELLNSIFEVSGLKPTQNVLQGSQKNQLLTKFLRGNYFPDSLILGKQNVDKTSYLFKQLCSFLEVPTFTTRLVFKYDPILPQNNYFNYIKGKKNMLILIKLMNGVVLGGFSAFPFEDQPKRPGKGLIFSLTAEKTFKMKKDPRVGVYTPDTFFLIFGSSELRLKYTEKKFYSNFGVANGTFQTAGFTRQQFLAAQTNVNEVEFQSYQIYTLGTSQE